jgi:hypothetical protein
MSRLARSVVAGCCMLLSFCGAAVAQTAAEGRREPTADEQQAMNELGERLVAALRAGDQKKALECWLSWESIAAEIPKLPPEERPAAAAVEAQRNDVRRRDEINSLTIPLLIRLLRDFNPKPEDLKLVRLTGLVRMHRRNKMTDDFVLTMRNAQGDEFVYELDDGVFLENRWHFTDKPDMGVEVRRGGRSAPVELSDYATEDERQKLEAARKSR